MSPGPGAIGRSVKSDLPERARSTAWQTLKVVKVLTSKPIGGALDPELPTELRNAFAATPAAQAAWTKLTPIARRDFMSWISSAKQLETRRRRIEKACSMLAAGKRRPCCYSIVSLDLHLALKAAPEAKAQWGVLTADERRGFISWMDSAQAPETQRCRIEKACLLLAAGQRSP